MPERTIPAELRRKILVEAGHRCAIPTCRSLDVDIHHIIPWSTCNEHEYENLIALCPNCHRRADRNVIDKRSLRLYKNNLRFLYDKFTTFEIDLLFELYGVPDGQSILFPPFLILLIKRLREANYVKLTETPVGITLGGMKSNPDLLKITPTGKEFISQLSTENIGY